MNRLYSNFLVFCSLLSSSFFAEIPLPKPYYIVPALGRVGFFAEFNVVLAALDLYEKGECSGIKVDYASHGLYYEHSRGKNFWEYYFKPIEIGNKNNVPIMFLPEPATLAIRTRFSMSLERANMLIGKYIKVKKNIQNKVDVFCQNNFLNHFVIGVHYRGTDKYTEAVRLSYEEVVQEVSKFIQEKQPKNYRIFVATDEHQFVEYISTKFPGKIITTNAIRSKTGTPLHVSHGNRYQKGEDALVDCLLLSRTNFLFRMASNLSYASQQFNPLLSVKELNVHYHHFKS